MVVAGRSAYSQHPTPAARQVRHRQHWRRPRRRRLQQRPQALPFETNLLWTTKQFTNRILEFEGEGCKYNIEKRLSTSTKRRRRKIIYNGGAARGLGRARVFCILGQRPEPRLQKPWPRAWPRGGNGQRYCGCFVEEAPFAGINSCPKVCFGTKLLLRASRKNMSCLWRFSSEASASSQLSISV